MRTPLIVILVFAAMSALCARSFASPSALCNSAAQFAADKTGVPLSILRAVTLAETGRTVENSFAAWPWAIQSGNQGNWFPDQDAALSYVEGLMAQGTRNIDIGCFQLNLRWHGAAFQSLEDMISPQQNAVYAAGFLQDLYQQTGDWRSAVGRYHSRDEDRARTYVSRLETLYNTHLAAASPDRPAPRATPAQQTRPQPQRFGLAVARGPLIAMGAFDRPLIGGLR